MNHVHGYKQVDIEIFLLADNVSLNNLQNQNEKEGKNPTVF